MLVHLQIKDFAIIENLDHELVGGMSVITGETGAGKSIIIDALGLILGGKAKSEWIRHHADRCDISGTFDISQKPNVMAWLQEEELGEDSECIIRRTLTRDGRSRSYINGKVVPIQKIRDLCDQLIHIHGQHQHQALLKHDIQRDMLDAYAGTLPLAQAAKSAFSTLKQIQATLTKERAHKQARMDRLELLQYQLQELEQQRLEVEYIEDLNKRHKLISNRQKLLDLCSNLLNTLDNPNKSVLQQLHQSAAQFQQFQALDNNLAQVNHCLSQAVIFLQETVSEIANFVDADANTDLNETNKIEQALETLHDLARKHQVPVLQLDTHYQSLLAEKQTLDSVDKNLEALEEQLQEALTQYQLIAEQLSEKRRVSATMLSAKITEKIMTLAMPHSQFLITLNTLAHPTAHGLETISMLISANPGSMPKPLAEVASGGELSRICLAIQVVIAERYQTPILIFDEVDVGIGGATAEIVGHLLKQLGAQSQVLCITHLPQVAASANHHLRVTKTVKDNLTSSSLVVLNKEQRVEEIARMVAGVEITKQSLAHAKALLKA